MKTRIVFTRVWEDDWFINLNQQSKFLWLYLLTNHRINLCGLFELSDRVIIFETGLSKEEVDVCKKSLEPKVYFYKGWCFIPKSMEMNGYIGEKTEVASLKEWEQSPIEVRRYYLDTLSIPYRYPIDTTINQKSYIINKKSEIKNPKSETIKDFKDIKKMLGERLSNK